MKKRFVAVVEYEEEDVDPMDLSSLATWVDVALGRASGVSKLEATVYHSAVEASMDELSGEAGKGYTVVGARLVDGPGADGKQLCVALKDGTERLLHLYYPEGVPLVVEDMLGKTIAQVQLQD